jgi:Flp pilus assembly protein TadD
VYGVALNSAGETERGMQVLRDAAERHPFDRDLLVALATLSRDAGEREAAVGYAERLTGLFPEDAEARTLLVRLRSSPG